MAKILKAIPTTYRGIEFRSKLEAKYAQAFDRLEMVWEYEGHGFAFDDGTWYCPDFYMPEIDTYFEVKGVMDEASRRKVAMLAREMKRVVVGGPDGSLHIYVGTMADDDGDGYYVDTASPTICGDCGKAYFREVEMVWSCPACGRSGDGFIVVNGEMDDNNLFSAAGW